MRICPECEKRTEAEICPHDGRMTLEEAALHREDPILGTVIAEKYEVLERVGRGGMGTVYKSRHKATGGLLALKLLRTDIVEYPEAVKRFHLEAQNMAAVNHPNVVSIADFGVHKDCVFLAMEFLVGKPLSKLIEEEAPLAAGRVVAIVCQVLKGLWAAHEHPRRIVHRDIKPENIFLVEEAGHQEFVKVLDFGIARSLEGTRVGTRGLIGTPGYMSPEQWRGAEVDPRTDLYAVGCLMYEMLSGKAPFHCSVEGSAGIKELSRAHLHDDPAPLRANVGQSVPEGLVALTHALLAKAMDDRPVSAEAVLKMLENAERLEMVTNETIATGDLDVSPEELNVEKGARRDRVYLKHPGRTISLCVLVAVGWFYFSYDSGSRVNEEAGSRQTGPPAVEAPIIGTQKDPKEGAPKETTSQSPHPDTKHSESNRAATRIQEIEGSPKNADVFWVEGNKMLGTTPFLFSPTPAMMDSKPFTLRLSKKGYRTEEMALQAEWWRESKPLSYKLERKYPGRPKKKDKWGGF